ncbi:hypothetical protein BJ742DRAFT_740230 [Cladochytrium replicatum]|nr:hypothetical protein BJ742DRAFT_740230 [Cladochytrium replicatum]
MPIHAIQQLEESRTGSVSIHQRKANIKYSSPHHLDYVPWDKAKKHLAYPGAPKSRTHVPLQRSISGPLLPENINLARKWREWQLAENLRGRPEVKWSPQFLSKLMRMFVVYQSKQREVERACKIIATQGRTRDNWCDSKNDLVTVWGDAPVNSSNATLAILALKKRIKA